MSTVREVCEDVWHYLLRRPARRTFVPLPTAGARDEYDRRIVERLGVGVADHSVLNVHRLGVEAPAAFVWEMLARWRPDAGYWPNGLARAVLVGDGPDRIDVFLFGLASVPLFTFDILKRQAVPRAADVDNARYVLYRCSGGYPIGIFSMYVRSAIAAEPDRKRTELFFVVAFDFFGRKHWRGARAVRPVWESIHNRVTAHALARFKRHCEEAFARLQAGRDDRL